MRARLAAMQDYSGSDEGSGSDDDDNMNIRSAMKARAAPKKRGRRQQAAQRGSQPGQQTTKTLKQKQLKQMTLQQRIDMLAADADEDEDDFDMPVSIRGLLDQRDHNKKSSSRAADSILEAQLNPTGSTGLMDAAFETTGAATSLADRVRAGFQPKVPMGF